RTGESGGQHRLVVDTSATGGLCLIVPRQPGGGIPQPSFERWYGNVELCGCLVGRTAAQPDRGRGQCLCMSEGFKFLEPGRNGLHTINIAYVLGVRTVIAADLLGNGVNPGNYGSVSGLFIGVIDIEVKCEMWCLTPERGIRISRGLHGVMFDWKKYGEHAVDLR